MIREIFVFIVLLLGIVSASAIENAYSRTSQDDRLLLIPMLGSQAANDTGVCSNSSGQPAIITSIVNTPSNDPGASGLINMAITRITETFTNILNFLDIQKSG